MPVHGGCKNRCEHSVDIYRCARCLGPLGFAPAGNTCNPDVSTGPPSNWPDSLKKAWAATEAAQKKRERVGAGMQMCNQCESHKAELCNLCRSCFFASPANQGFLNGQFGRSNSPGGAAGFSAGPAVGGLPPGASGVPSSFRDLDALRAATAAEEKRRADLEVRVAARKKRVRTAVVYLPDEPLHYTATNAAQRHA